MTVTNEAPGAFARGVHGIVLSFPVALFTTALAADVAYLATAEMQWSNFASWAIAGALLFGGLALLWALVDWLRRIRRTGGVRRLAYLLVLALMFAAGLVNAFHHARDGWSSVGTTGLALSLVSALLALLAGWMAFSRTAAGETAR